MMEKLEFDKLNLHSKVKILCETDYPKEETIEYWIDYMNSILGISSRGFKRWFLQEEYNELWEIKTIAGFIVSFLTWESELSDLFYHIKDSTIFIDRLNFKLGVKE